MSLSGTEMISLGRLLMMIGVSGLLLMFFARIIFMIRRRQVYKKNLHAFRSELEHVANGSYRQAVVQMDSKKISSCVNEARTVALVEAAAEMETAVLPKDRSEMETAVLPKDRSEMETAVLPKDRSEMETAVLPELDI